MTNVSGKGRLLVTALLVLLGMAAHAAADPINVSSGYIHIQSGGPTSVNLFWAGGSLIGHAGNSSNADDAAPWPPYACNFCTAGALVNPSLSVQWPTSNEPGSFLDAHLNRNGTTYTLKSLALNIDADPVTIPDVPSGEGSTYGAANSSLFTMTGSLIAMANNSSLIALTIIGRGSTGVLFQRGPDNGVPVTHWFSSVYIFTEPSTATPEPGTMLLLGGGIAAVVARRRKAKQAVAA